MIFCLILIVLTGAVAFFHYIQGFFSATISVILIAIAAVIAVGYHETVASYLVGAKIPDQAASMAIVLVFAAAYIIPRLVFDAAIPGNVRYPVIVDKVGAGVMGLIAGLLALGVIALAADALPFGPSIGLYSRFETVEKAGLIVTPSAQALDVQMHDVIVPEKLDPAVAQHVWLWNDDLVMGLAAKVSNDGSLSGDRPLASVHPDYLDELYGQRLGIQSGAKHTLQNSETNKNMSVTGVFTQPKIAQVDGALKEIRNRRVPLPAYLEPAAGQALLIIRTTFNGKDMGDSQDNIFRFSTGAVRLLLGRETDSGPDYQDYHPIGILDPTNVAVIYAPDDFLFADTSGERTIDFIFQIDKDKVGKGLTLPDGAFLQVKRLALADLSGMKVKAGPPRNPDNNSVLRQPQITTLVQAAHPIPVSEAASVAVAAEGGSTPAVAGVTVDPTGGAINFLNVAASSKLPVKIDAHSTAAAGTVDLPSGVKGIYAAKKWTSLTVTPETPAKDLATPGTGIISDLDVASGFVMVQAHCKAPATADADVNWQWATKVSTFILLDATGNEYHPVGAWGNVQRGAQTYFLASYHTNGGGVKPIAQPAQGRPTDFWIAFEVRTGASLTELHFGDANLVNALNFTAPGQ